MIFNIFLVPLFISIIITAFDRSRIEEAVLQNQQRLTSDVYNDSEGDATSSSCHVLLTLPMEVQ